MAVNKPNDRKRAEVKARKLALETGMNRAARRAERMAALRTPAAPVVTEELKAKGKAKKKAKEDATATPATPTV
jgi:hypothetical protein